MRREKTDRERKGKEKNKKRGEKKRERTSPRLMKMQSELDLNKRGGS